VINTLSFIITLVMDCLHILSCSVTTVTSIYYDNSTNNLRRIKNANNGNGQYANDGQYAIILYTGINYIGLHTHVLHYDNISQY